jgi:adenine-specific DNA glycosylase
VNYTPIQAQYRSDPYRVLVCTMLLNNTSRDQVVAVIEDLFERFPTARAMASADESLEACIAPCGLSAQRAGRLRRMAEELAHAPVLSPGIIGQLTGCSRYAADSFAIFCQGYTDVRPTDKVLKEYLKGRASNV